MNKLLKRNELLALLLVVVVAALYGQFLWNAIIFDDLQFFMLDSQGNQPVSLYHFNWLELRSLPYATLAWTKAWFGLDLINFRVGNLLLHAAVVVALFAFLRYLFKVISPETSSPDSLTPSLAAFLAALLFALHPVSTYAVGYLVQRTIVMAALFGLLALLSYLHGSAQKSQFWLWMSVPFYYLAVLSKEHAIMLPAVFIALTLLLHTDWQVQLKQRWGIFAALTLIAIFVVLARKGLIGSVYEVNGLDLLGKNAKLAYPLSVITQCWLFFKYALLWIFPNPTWMSIDMREPFALSLWSPYLIALLCFVAWGAGAVWLLLKRGGSGLVGLAMLFPWLMFFTEFSSVRIQEPFVLYRSYIWAMGAFCLLPVLFTKTNGKTASFVVGIVALAMVPISMDRLMTLSHPLLLWSDAEKLVKNHPELPGAYRIYYNRGTELIRVGNFNQAMLDLKLAVALTSNFFEANGNLGAAYFQTGDWNNAVVFFGHGIEMARKAGSVADPRYIYGRAQAYEQLGELTKAQVDYQESCRLIKKGCEKLPGASVKVGK